MTDVARMARLRIAIAEAERHVADVARHLAAIDGSGTGLTAQSIALRARLLRQHDVLAGYVDDLGRPAP